MASPAETASSQDELTRLLDSLIEAPDRIDEIEAEIDRVFGAERTVMALDMSGFSRTTQKLGIAAFLLMIHQMKKVACPSIEAHGGLLVKGEADNLFCLFPSPSAALAAARAIMARLETVNLLLPEAKRLYAAIGIGHGRMLLIDGRDMFGDEVNLACKLGEDIAERGQIVLTPAARAQIEGEVPMHEAQASISGLALSYFVVERG